MAPDLFLRPMDIILEETASQGHLGVNIGTECFTELDYADDVALLAVSCGDVVDSLEKMGQEASKFGLEINWSKTKIQPVGVQGLLPEHILVAGNEVEIVRGFCYLGSHVEADRGSGPEVHRRVAIARDCMNSLQRGIWKSSICIDMKLRLFKVYILPILLYGAETWTLTMALEAKLDVFQRWCLRQILRIPFSAHVTNSAIYQRAEQIPVSEMVLSRRLSSSATLHAATQSWTTRERAMIGPPPRTWKRPVGLLDKPGCERSRLTCSL